MTSRVTLLVALLFRAPNSAAASPEAPARKLRLEVRSPAECTSRSDVAARVAARSLHIQIADDAAITAQVTVTSSVPGDVIAELVLRSGGAEQPPRRFVARSCAEAADAVALIIAVTLDPNLPRRSEPSAAPEVPAGRSPAEPKRGPDSQPLAEPVEQPPPTEQPLPAAVEVQAAPSPPAPPSATKRRFGATLAGQTIFGAVPSVMLGVSVYVMAELERDGPWAPALVMGVTRVSRANLDEPGGTASFVLYSASVDACPLRLRWWRLAARPCVSTLVGRMTASGTDTDDGASTSRPFATAGAVMIVGVGSTVELSARVGIGVTLIRDSYEFASTVFHRAGPTTTTASLGIGLRWP